MRSSYSNTFVFFRPHANEKPAFSKISTLERVFKKMRLRWPFSWDTCGRYAKADGKKSLFSSKKRCVWTGPKFCITFVFLFLVGISTVPRRPWRWQPHRLSKRQSLSIAVLFRTTFSQTIPLNRLVIHSFLRGRVSFCLFRRNFIFQAKGPQWPGSVVRGVNSGLQRVRQQAFWRWFYCFPDIRVVMKV